MNYTDSLFLFLFWGLFICSTALSRAPRLKEWIIVAFSAMILVSWGFPSLIIFLLTALANYGAALAIAAAPRERSGLVLFVAIGLNVLNLAAFKYSTFLLHDVFSIPDFGLGGFPFSLPLGISFYTFHCIGYLVDVERARSRPAPFRKYFFYLIFFPHVVAGPIVRGWQLIPQIGVRRLSKYDLAFGFHYLLFGYFLKTVGADNIGAAVDRFWTVDPSIVLTAVESWCLAALYYCQIYSDFAGYSLMAIGMARLLGYNLPANFRQPMRAVTLREFWRRWHVTLSRWLRDYLYIPLGGNRRGKARTIVNLLLTMVIGGFWHGAGWGFPVWGLMHGVGLAAEHLAGQKDGPSAWPAVVAAWLVTQTWVTLAWVFFRSPSLAFASGFIQGMVRIGDAGAWTLRPEIGVAMIFALPALLHHLVFFRAKPSAAAVVAFGVATGMLLIAALVVRTAADQPFIYFRF